MKQESTYEKSKEDLLQEEANEYCKLVKEYKRYRDRTPDTEVNIKYNLK